MWNDCRKTHFQLADFNQSQKIQKTHKNLVAKNMFKVDVSVNEAQPRQRSSIQTITSHTPRVKQEAKAKANLQHSQWWLSQSSYHLHSR